jgi:hypothetical protein
MFATKATAAANKRSPETPTRTLKELMPVRE